jgi:hypothetical protein
MQRAHGRDEGYAKELAVIDVSNAFMSLAVEEKELPHTRAPNIDTDDFYMFVALLFGYKTAPLLWSRVAALLSRLLQSAIPGSSHHHQTYLHGRCSLGFAGVFIGEKRNFGLHPVHDGRTFASRCKKGCDPPKSRGWE